MRVLDSRDFLPAMIHGKPCSLKMFWSRFGSKREDDECYLKVSSFLEVSFEKQNDETVSDVKASCSMFVGDVFRHKQY